jgi:hypothetical protein
MANPEYRKLIEMPVLGEERGLAEDYTRSPQSITISRTGNEIG